MQVYVLLDKSSVVYGVLTDREAAESFIGYDPDFMYVEVELDDYTALNELAAEVGDEAPSFGVTSSRGQRWKALEQ